MSDPTYGTEEKQKLERQSVNEGVTVLQEIEDLQAGLKETVKAVAEELDVKVALINKAIKVAKNMDWDKHSKMNLKILKHWLLQLARTNKFE